MRNVNKDFKIVNKLRLHVYFWQAGQKVLLLPPITIR